MAIVTAEVVPTPYEGKPYRIVIMHDDELIFAKGVDSVPEGETLIIQALKCLEEKAD